MKRIAVIGLGCAALLLGGCKTGMFQSADAVFAEQSSVVGLYIEGRQAFVYDAELHQTAQGNASFRLQTDDQSTYLNLLFDPIPTSDAPTVWVSVASRGIKGLTDQAYEFKRIEERDGKMWLWNNANKIGLIIPIL